MRNTQFSYTDERFADILMLRYKLDNFSSLSLRQKKLVYYLSEAALYGRDITFNDGAVALAEHLSGSVEEFVDGMNARAENMGLKNSHFVNTNGLPVARIIIPVHMI